MNKGGISFVFLPRRQKFTDALNVEIIPNLKNSLSNVSYIDIDIDIDIYIYIYM